ncbi:hypothetical protein [Salinibacterium sp. SWN167]|uniref:hypothetical protein n=1 Tax=Salinibacterium sp. SWN167 TaxID=2792054 RepID=UPI0018CDF425|nr:hypothetical protein [Salinibacterium sp. SWN167]MBH0084270.1 hypothetical protein [Salinibacterium sp. SWN167]
MPTSDSHFDELANELEGSGASAGSMFSKRSLMIQGKGFACLKDDFLAFRLGAGSDAHTAALVLDGSELFDPSGKGRPFKDWVAVPSAHAEQWSELAEAALLHITSGAFNTK